MESDSRSWTRGVEVRMVASASLVVDFDDLRFHYCKFQIFSRSSLGSFGKRVNFGSAILRPDKMFA